MPVTLDLIGLVEDDREPVVPCCHRRVISSHGHDILGLEGIVTNNCTIRGSERKGKVERGRGRRRGGGGGIVVRIILEGVHVI